MIRYLETEDFGISSKHEITVIVKQFLSYLRYMENWYWAIPENNQTGEVKDIEFPGVLKKELVGLIKSNVEFRGVVKKK